MCIAAGGRRGVAGEDVKFAMYEFAMHLGLKLPGDLWDWDARAHAGWLIRDMLRRCAGQLGEKP
jgi:hypothetical protein